MKNTKKQKVIIKLKRRMKEKERMMRELLPFENSSRKKMFNKLKEDVNSLFTRIYRLEKGLKL